MKIFNKIICLLLTLTMVLPLFSTAVMAEESNIYSIQNDYVRYTINSETGGFSVETLDGNPQKDLDNNIPLLYKEDETRSNGTSFTTIRIDGKDYVFGRSYGFFGLSTTLHTPVVSEGGRLITVKWDIKDYTVTQEVALSAEADQDLTGNVGISYTITNNGSSSAPVGIRVLLDTALDSTVDSPYLVKDTDIDIISVETEYSRENGTMPSQIRGLDSLSNPSKMLYTFTKTWNNDAAAVDRIIVGHWRNLANTRYDYEANRYCDFTNYSNSHRTPDSAIAYYWDETPLAGGASRVAEIIYGVGNFSQSVENEGVGLNMSIDNKIRLNNSGDGYVNDGKFDVTVVVDNSVSDAQVIDGAVVTLSFDDGVSPVGDTYITQSFDKLEIGDVKTLRFHLQAQKQEVITAKTIGVTLTGTQDLADGNARVATFNTQRSVVVPGVKGKYPDVKVSKLSPETVFTGGDKTVTVTGSLSPLKAIEGTDGWKMFLYHTTTDHKVEIAKNRIAFIDDEYTKLTISTGEELSVGEYEIGFEFTDTQLVDGFGVTALKLGKKIAVSNDPIYKVRAYGIMALVRHNQRDYSFIPFADQEEYNHFLDGLGIDGKEYNAASGNGYPDINGDMIAPFEPVDTSDPSTLYLDDKEVILIMRGSFRQSEKENGSITYQASSEDSDITINEILSYKSKEPLVIKEDGGLFSVSGDGDLAVIGSIDVWPGQWSFKVNKDTVTTLDADRCHLSNPNELELELGGVGYMVQSIGGFLIDIKYGVMSSSRPVDSDRTLIYGISFGGSISIPIKLPSSVKQKADVQAEEAKNKKDVAESQLLKTDSGELDSEIFGTMFDEDKAVKDADELAKANSRSKTSKPESDFKKDTNLDSGLLSAAINDIRFGQEAEEQDDGSVKITDTGFIGIDATLALGLPKDVLGTLVTNAPGVYASLTINTIDHFYMIEAGLDIKLIQCEGVLSFAMTDVKGVDVVVPDSIQFYIRDGLQIPIVPPAFYLTGLGGGIDGLADTIGGEFSKLPPITLLLYSRFELVELLVGDFNASIALSGITLDGDLYLNVPGLIQKKQGGNQGTTPGGNQGNTPGGNQGTTPGGTPVNGVKNSPKNPANRSSFVNSVINAVKSPVSIELGASARWIDPISFKAYGSVSIIDGLLSGGVTITITDKSFYGYAYLSLCIPESIPIIGGKELAGIEAAISDKFVGANLKILGIKLGFIYYWGGDFSIGTGINLMGIDSVDYPEYSARAVYGTNLRKLGKKNPSGIQLMAAGDNVTHSFTVAGEDSIMIEIPFEAKDMPTADDFAVTGPNGEITLVPDDGQGGGNYLVQSREDGNYIYVSVTDKNKIADGNWTVSLKTDKLAVSTFDIFGVGNIPEINSITASRGSDTSSYDINLAWALDSESSSSGYLDVYLSKDRELLEKIKSSDSQEQDIDAIAHLKLDEVKSGSQTVTIPDSFESGTYYIAAMLTNDVGGMSTIISDTTFDFVNKKLPKSINSAKAVYAGNGGLYVEIEDAEDYDYTHYVVEVVAEDGTTLSNNIAEFGVGEDIFIGREANLVPGSSYTVKVKTLRNEDNKKFYYGADIVESAPVTMPVIDKPVLTSVVTNVVDGITDEDTLEVTYNFDRPVWMYATINSYETLATDFKETWKVSYDLADGEYVVDFKAYGKNKDFVTGDDFPDVPNAKMGFKVDSNAPALSIKKNGYETLGKDGNKNVTAQFGSNVVFADITGDFTVEGVTDYNATLTADGENVEVGNNGTFKYQGRLAEDESSRQITLKATDSAGNESTLTVFAITEGAVTERVEILLNGSPIERSADGEAVINLKTGDMAALTVAGYSEDGKKHTVENPVWDVLYEKNIIEFSEGNITAKLTGETSVKAGIKNGIVTFEDSSQADMLVEDYVIISISANTKDDLYSAILAAERSLASPQNASQSAIDAFTAEIAAAKAVYNNAGASADEIENTTVALKNAITAFEAAKQGLSYSRGGGGGSQKVYTIKVEETQNGRVTVSQDKVYSGTSITITSTPDAGYEVEEVTVNGVSYGCDEVVTVAAVMENLTVKVTFRPEWKNPFADVAKDDWFYTFVRWAHENGIMKGTYENMFSPDEALTRAMLVTIFWRAEGEPVAGNTDFEDVSETSYYAKAVAWAEANGIVKGYSETKFAPEDNILREQFAAIIYRYANYKGYDVSVGENTNILSYTDADEISEYAIPAMQYAVGSGLIKGKSGTTLDPQANATRAESATILMRFIENNKK